VKGSRDEDNMTGEVGFWVLWKKEKYLSHFTKQPIPAIS